MKKRNRIVVLYESNFVSTKVQQTIQGYPIVKGYHYNTDKEFLFANMIHFANLKQQVDDGTHILLLGSIIEDEDDFTKELKKKYEHDYDRNFRTIINLSFSEN
jgi:hypothetical protein